MAIVEAESGKKVHEDLASFIIMTVKDFSPVVLEVNGSRVCDSQTDGAVKLINFDHT